MSRRYNPVIYVYTYAAYLCSLKKALHYALHVSFMLYTESITKCINIYIERVNSRVYMNSYNILYNTRLLSCECIYALLRYKYNVTVKQTRYISILLFTTHACVRECVCVCAAWKNTWEHLIRGTCFISFDTRTRIRLCIKWNRIFAFTQNPKLISLLLGL